MSFEVALLRWALWSLIFAAALGGKPWYFPDSGIWILSCSQCEHDFARITVR